MLLLVLVIWTGSLLLWGNTLAAPFRYASSVWQWIVLGMYVAMIAFFWLLTAYYVSVLLCYFLVRRQELPRQDHKEPVAILYTVCNDFQSAAADSCVFQNYANYHLFILDDSTQADQRAKVDAWAKEHESMATVIRRENNVGFKAGNLNHALHEICEQYAFFAVADADERLPEDFLSRMMPCFSDERIAFVQAAHQPNQNGLSGFGYDLSVTICPFWLLHIVPRNRFGNVVYMGHGALIRTAAWKDVDGFPLLTSEDFAFSIRLLEHGWRGVYNDKVICTEDFPSDYGVFRRQQKRYVAGSVEAISTCMKSMLKSRSAGLIEKADMLFWSIPLYIPAIALIYLIITSVFLPLAFGSFHAPTFVLFGHELTLPKLLVIRDVFSGMNGVSYRLFSAFCTLSPIFATLTLGITRRLPMRRVIRLVVYSTAAYMSLMLNAWKGIFRFIRKKIVQWKPTGDVRTKRQWLWDELILGTVLLALSALTMNLSGLAVSLSVVSGVFAVRFSWEAKPVRFVSVLNFSLLLAHIVLSLIQSFSPMIPAMPMVFSIHF